MEGAQRQTISHELLTSPSCICTCSSKLCLSTVRLLPHQDSVLLLAAISVVV